MSQNQIPVTDVSSQGHGGCGCGCSSVQDELPRLDARPFPSYATPPFWVQ